MISFDSFERIASAPLSTWPGTLVVAALSVLFAIGVHLVGGPYPGAYRAVVSIDERGVDGGRESRKSGDVQFDVMQ
ncbi:MAG: hypothetical protein CBARDMAM_5225 [uncultured Caballeronia sp.]|nr:MAG: hypothetical protein CBARDMAM_5225 [uncultured Caballeronia sp.]